MDFGAVGLDGLVGPQDGAASQVQNPDPQPKGHGSGLAKQERSGSAEDDWRSSKLSKTDDFGASKTMLLPHSIPLMRSNSVLSDDGRQLQHILSFSSPKPEASLLSKDGGLVGKNTQSTALPSLLYTPSAYSRNAGYGSGSLSASMHGTFAGVRGPFTPSQWIELEHQALIYKYLTANVPVPSNLLIPIKKSMGSFGLSGMAAGSLPAHTLGWGSFHLGFSSNTDPEPGRCRRTDGKKWRCSRDAVADQKYCERHINRGRHRSRKPVEGQTGHAVSGPTNSTNSKVAPVTPSVSASVLSSGGTSNSLAITQHQLKNLQPAAANPSSNTLANRIPDPQGLSIISLSNLKSRDAPFSIPKQQVPYGESHSDFGIVSSDCLLNPSQKNSFVNSKNYSSFMDFNGQGTQDQQFLRQFMEEWPKDQSSRSGITWPEELKSDWTQLSMSIPMASSDFSSCSSSPAQERLAHSPLRLSREFDPVQMGLGVSNHDIGEPTQKQTNWIPISWGTSLGGPLGEVLNNAASAVSCKSTSALNLSGDAWDGSPQLGSSPTGVLQKATFVSLSNSSSGSSPRADNKKTHDASLCDDVLGSTLASCSSVPSL